jgi:hypothetical protein
VIILWVALALLVIVAFSIALGGAIERRRPK